MRKKMMCLLICLMCLLSFVSCAGGTVWKTASFDTEASGGIPEDMVVAENDHYQLEWTSANCGVALVDKTTGRRWGTTPVKEGEPEVDELGMPIKKHPKLESAIVVTYLNESTYVEEEINSAIGAVKNGRIRTELLESGIRVEYYFDEVEIMVPVEYILREDSVEIGIDPKQIQENEKLVTSIAVAPFWCSAENDSSDSYLFFPSGSGTIISCDTVSQAGKAYSASVYGDDPTMQADALMTTERAVRIPVYGAKTQTAASCAIIESSAESADIKALVGSSALKYSAVYASFQMRGYSRNNVQYLNNVQKEMEVFHKGMIDTPLKVGFYPLAGEQADYSGMAQIYKDYLKNNGKLAERVRESSLNVTFVGGTMIKKSFLGVPYEELLPTTTLEDAKKILTELSDETDGKISARLLGYGVTGIDRSDYAGGFRINRHLGSLEDLSELSEQCENTGVDLYFDFDLIRFHDSSFGYSRLFDSAYNACSKLACGYDYDVVTRASIPESEYSLLKRELLTDGANRLQKKIKGWKLSGISLASLGSLAYSDYSTFENAAYYSQGGMAADVEKIMGGLGEGYKLASEEANVYAALMSDVIYNAPTDSSQEKIFDQDIPFYQMVFKGYVSMGCQSLNMASEPKKQLLKAIESGCGLSWTLTAEYQNELIDSASYYFFGSRYEDVKDSLLETCDGLKDYYAAIDGAEMISHHILENGIRETIFDNGVRVYVNYEEQSAASPLGQVQLLSYLWEGRP